MDREIVRNPSREMIAKWDILAYVDEAERARILSVSFGRFKGEVERLKKEVDLIKFPRKRKNIITTSWYNPKVKQLTKAGEDNKDVIDNS